MSDMQEEFNDHVADRSRKTPVDSLVMLPVYESSATPEEREETRAWMAKQLSVIVEQEERLEIRAKFLKIRCGCNKFVQWKHMFRCLYCGVWFCKECAEQHFGKRVPESFAGVER